MIKIEKGIPDISRNTYEPGTNYKELDQIIYYLSYKNKPGVHPNPTFILGKWKKI